MPPIAVPYRPPAIGVQSFPLSDGLPGTAQTIGYIRELVRQAVMDIDVNREALAIVAAVGGYNPLGEAQAIFEWVITHITFRRDVRGYETLRAVREILFVGAGDCDDINGILLPALLMSVGIPARVVTIATDPASPREFTHIYCEAYIRGKWVPLDAAVPNPVFGQPPAAKYFRKRAWSLIDRQYEDLAGHRLGDFWSSFTSALPGIESGAAQLITASNQPSFPTYATNTAGQVVNTSTGQVVATSTSATSVLPWILGLGVGVVAIALILKK